MTDSATTSSGGSGVALGQASYENGFQGHMPPPLNINTSMPEYSMGSPLSGSGSISRSAPEPNKRALYVGGLDPRVTEDVLKQIFETTGHVQSVKIIPDKNVSALDFLKLQFARVCFSSRHNMWKGQPNLH